MIFKSFLFPSTSTTSSILSSLSKSSSILPLITKQHIEERIIDNINPYHLYNIIQDVNRYKEFIPYCTESKIIQYYNTTTTNNNNNKLQQHVEQQNNVEQHVEQQQQQQQQQKKNFDAILTIGYLPFFTETYTSAVTCNESLLTIEANSIQSTLFHSLRSKWKLYPILPILTNHNHNQNQNQLQPISQLSSSTTNLQNQQQQQQQQTKVYFEVSISTTDPIIGTTLDTVLQQIADQQVIAFTKRCHQLPTTFYKQ